MAPLLVIYFHRHSTVERGNMLNVASRPKRGRKEKVLTQTFVCFLYVDSSLSYQHLIALQTFLFGTLPHVMFMYFAPSCQQYFRFVTSVFLHLFFIRFT